MSGFSYPAEVLANAVRLGRALESKAMMLVSAESCTGGLIACALTEVAGSSRWFERGFVTYSNQAKEELLGVPGALLLEHGAVSEPVAQAMAKGALSRSRAQLALAVTGIAGPGGGSPDKPVGTVCFGWAMSAGPGVVQISSETHVFPGDRNAVRAQSASFALVRALSLVPVRSDSAPQAPSRPTG
jgi:nicotinamide-nucleotide amidase